MKKVLLILDLDETLIHATSQKIRDDFDFQIYHYFVYKRPYLDEFIKICSENFMLAVWSSASDDYVAEIVQKIFPHTTCILRTTACILCTAATCDYRPTKTST